MEDLFVLNDHTSNNSARALRREILQITDELPFDQAQMIWLRDICDLSYRDAARITHRSTASIAELVRRARLEIRTKLHTAEQIS